MTCVCARLLCVCAWLPMRECAFAVRMCVAANVRVRVCCAYVLGCQCVSACYCLRTAAGTTSSSSVSRCDKVTKANTLTHSCAFFARLLVCVCAWLPSVNVCCCLRTVVGATFSSSGSWCGKAIYNHTLYIIYTAVSFVRCVRERVCLRAR